MIRFNLDEHSPIPIYQQLKQKLLLEILSKRIIEGDKLPPIRNLAKILKINPSTVVKAYNSLVEEGIIEAKRGSGYLIKTQKTKPDKFKTMMIEDEFKLFLEKAFSFGFSSEDIDKLIKRVMNHEN
jgi:GntR family transcriptional regulator